VGFNVEVFHEKGYGQDRREPTKMSVTGPNSNGPAIGNEEGGHGILWKLRIANG